MRYASGKEGRRDAGTGEEWTGMRSIGGRAAKNGRPARGLYHHRCATREQGIYSSISRCHVESERGGSGCWGIVLMILAGKRRKMRSEGRCAGSWQGTRATHVARRPQQPHGRLPFLASSAEIILAGGGGDGGGDGGSGQGRVDHSMEANLTASPFAACSCAGNSGGVAVSSATPPGAL